MPTSMPDDYYRLLHDLQAVDFVLVELTLYLDTHPTDEEAVKQFNHYSSERKKLKKQIERSYGPLQQYGNSYSATDKWNWSDGPWPWQV
ncbi:protein CotJB [Fictibacillus macauensis ZFHKF-1]|uniref:Protein CotJB n=1 Tax=Fictibacillus macauensis ZFHKF-1 TaxID=1196324 RepID=I8UFF1_9BACL|nr:spore coat protein CotJB [Fictibacillus macauensis]EIT85533.1 protein CotJB [Fictibacillus macauensis ZFHKF-1]